MALSYVRTIELTVGQIIVLFTDDISTSVGVHNVLVTAEFNSIPNPEVRSVSVENDLVTITFDALFPNIQYKITFVSTDTQGFETVNGEKIIEDGNRNSFFLVSPGEEENDIRDGMFDDISTLYETGEPTLVRDLVSSMGLELQKASTAIQTIKAGNYLSVTVTDEVKTRDDGPIDILDQGGAFEILRVSSDRTGSTRTGTLEFNAARTTPFMVRSGIIVNTLINTIGLDPISLQSVDVINEKVTDDIQAANNFSGLKIKVSKSPVLQVISVSLKRDNEYTEYDMELFGYTLKDNKYDTVSGSINVNLLDSEIELSSSSITGTEGGFLTPRAGDEIYISYVYKRLGRDVDPENVSITRIRTAVREVVPAVLNTFALENAPIVTSNDEIAVSDGVEFLNAQASEGELAFSTIHPAFTREIPYDVTKLPAKVGEYTINYETGDVIVFGEDEENRGTGDNNPVANYNYRQTFVGDLDYTFNSDRDEIAINSTRDMVGVEAKVTFGYEDTFAAGTDYRVLSHVEVLNERVNNKIVSDFQVQTENFPVTDVFRILNETTGEIYTLDRFNDTSVTFTGSRAPVQIDVDREAAMFSRVPQEVLLVSDELTNTSGLRVFKIELANNGLVDSQGRFIGANFDTSAILSETELFVREFFYEDQLWVSVDRNIDRLEVTTDYMIDYVNGIIYVAVTADQGTSLGDISYQHKKIETINDHILGVNNIYRSQSALQANVETYLIGTITDTTANITGLEQIGERFINGNSTRTLLVGTHQSGEDGITVDGSYAFVSNTAIFTTADINRTLIVGSASQAPVQEVLITGLISSHEITVSPAFDYTKSGRVWAVLDLSEDAPKTITLGNDIVSVKDIYTVTQLGTLPASELDGYFDINTDEVSGNVITLGASNQLDVGEAVVVSYNPGNIFIDYRYLKDELVISYEYGHNSLDWSISSALETGEEYYVTYKYGAMREPLLLNFGSLTQISQLTNFSPNLDREVYRAILGGTLQSFIEGPTVPSLERLVEAFTDVTPDISEAAFNNWVLGRDNLHLRKPEYNVNQTFDLGRFDNGVVISGDQNVQVPALAHLKLNEGTLETWIRPDWAGTANDAEITFDLAIDGYSDPEKVFIGFSGTSPEKMPFSLDTSGEGDINVVGEPANISSETGYFIWFDEFDEQWHMRWRAQTTESSEFSGQITTDGELYSVLRPLNSDGYEINEITDVITSSIHRVDFSAFIDGYDAATTTSAFATDGISFAADAIHYIFDMAEEPAANRMSLFKDGTGYLNFQVFDNRSKFGLDAGFYNISKNIRDWTSNSLHHVAVSWRFNSEYEKDEMHMFVDGQEVTNLFKYGGNPKASASFDFGDIAEEYITTYSPRAITGAYDGSTTAGSYVFSSESADFLGDGVQVGDPFYIFDDTPDGVGDPNFGAPYYITGVGTTHVTLDRAPTLTMGSLNYSAGAITFTVTTPVNIQDFIVVVVDADGNETELNGIDSEYPDYSIRRGGEHSHVITIANGVSSSDAVSIRPLGLILKRCRERVYVYGGGYDEIRLNAAAPVSLTDVKITGVILDRTLIETGGGFGLVGTIIGAQLVTLLQSYFDNVCQPSNQSAGRRLSVTLSGDNFNYEIAGNQVIIVGSTYSGAVKETLLFTESTTIVTDEYWTNIESITVSVVPIDAAQPIGAIEIKEYKPITVTENNGDFAEVVDYANGIIRLETYGTGGQPFILNACTYEVDYPSYLRVMVDAVPDTFYIGSDSDGENRFDGVIDEFRILDYMSEDTRVGEPLVTGSRTVTTDYSEPQGSLKDDNTLLLLHFDNETVDSSDFIDRFTNGYEVGDSINDDFGKAIKFGTTNPYEISNASSIFNSNEGTIEFWVNPYDDSKGDPNYHYYIDMSAVVEDQLESTSSLTVTTLQRIREVESVRLVTDVYNTETNYYTGGSFSNVDHKTITLGIPLPAQNVAIKVTYVPLSSQGDRVSVFRDPNGRINFFVKGTGVEHLITVPMAWDMHTWHRIMVMWKMNSTDNQDRLRLFVDGNERGTIKYGTGLIYGTGIIYGQAEVRPGVNRFLVDNIDLSDTFARIFVGGDVHRLNGARALIDNLRFSNVQRLRAIRVTTNDTIDINYSANSEFAKPVVEDIDTTAIYNFNRDISDVEFVTTLINAERGVFRFKVTVIDSFDKVKGNTDLEDLLTELINVIKPAHTEAIIEFTE